MTRRPWRAVIAAAFLWGTGASGAWAARPVLVLYKGSEGDGSDKGLAREHAHEPLRRLGYSVEYRDADLPLPDDAEMGRFAGVLTWFRGPRLAQAREYPGWLMRQAAAGRKVVVLGNFGAFTPDEKYWLPDNYLNEFFYPFGLEYLGEWTKDGSALEVAGKDSSMVERETPLDLNEINHYYRFASRYPRSKVFLSVRRKDRPGSESALVVRTPFGGFALESYLYKALPDGRLAWRLNLEAFLKDCLGAPGGADLLAGKRVLALYKSSEGVDAWDNEIRRFLWRPLYDLGFWADFRDVEAGPLPGPETARAYAGVVTWFRGATMTDAAAYCRWLAEWIAAGRKAVIFGNFGAFQERLPGTSPPVTRWLASREYNDFFSPFGLVFEGAWTKDSALLEVAVKDAAMVEAEVPLRPADIKHFFLLRGANPANRPFLTLRRKDLPESESQVIVQTPYGGFALESYLFTQDTATWRMSWRLDRKAFLAASLTSPAAPTPPRMPRREVSLTDLESGPRRSAAPPETGSMNGALEVPRRFLALYKSSEKDQEDRNRLYTWAEMPINWLGATLEYHDASKGLPADAEMSRFGGVLAWFGEPAMPGSDAYWEWLGRQVKAGRKVVLLGNPGASAEKATGLPTARMEEFFRALGLEYQSDRAAKRAQSRLLRRSWLVPPGGSSPHMVMLEGDPRLVGFEKPLDPRRLHEAYGVLSRAPGNRIHLRLHSPSLGEFHPLVTGPWGAIALGDIAVDQPTTREVQRFRAARGRDAQEQEDPPYAWTIDPFRFFETALGLKGRPRPDVTTLNGSRIFYAHIDGDGFTGVSLVDKASYSGRFVRDRILRRFNLPTTVSFVSRDIESKGGVFYNPALSLARSILDLPNTEGATHTFSHPFNWRAGDVHPVSTGMAVVRRPTELAKEVVYSVNYLDEFVMRPAGKRVEMLLWSGDCRPDGRAMELLDRIGLRNMNGGDPIFDAARPTYLELRPLAQSVGGFTQVHTSARGDFLYTDGWTKNFGDFAKVTDHFARTESPRRVAPINIYYHFYIGDREAGLEGLSQAYQYAESHRVAPLFASEFADIVTDFQSARVYALTGGGWRVLNAGALRTIRFDAPERRHLDLGRSRGVIGYSWHQGSLYAALDEQSSHDIYLTTAAPRVPYVERASHRVESWRAGPDSAEGVMRGVGKAVLVLRGFSPGAAFRVILSRAGGDGQAMVDGVRHSNSIGELRFESDFRIYGAAYAFSVGKAP